MHLNDVEYLLIGGYAVNYYGYARATADMDIWIASRPENADRIATAVREFGFRDARPDVFLQSEQIVRLGVPPLRIEFLTSISGVDFTDCYKHRIDTVIDGVPVKIIDLDHLKANKKAAGRLKDLTDIEQLEPPRV